MHATKTTCLLYGSYKQVHNLEVALGTYVPMDSYIHNSHYEHTQLLIENTEPIRTSDSTTCPPPPNISGVRLS